MSENGDGAMAPIHAAVANMAATIREVYMTCYREVTGKLDYGREDIPAWDGGEDQWGRVHKQPIWPKIAKRLTELNADPESFIRAQFWTARRGRPPVPSYLLSDVAAQRYQEYLKHAVTDTVEEYEREWASISAHVVTLSDALGWSRDRALRNGLLSKEHVNASPLLRYCVAVALGIDDVAARYHSRALLQYSFQQELYDNAWVGRIPETLRSESVEVRARVLRR